MLSEPVVSVVMSVYNGEPFLSEAMDSILNQSFENFECVAVNDGSTDSSGEILDYYHRSDRRVRVFHQDNRGMVESLNRGVAVARGRYIARMDADDVSLGERLGRQLAFLEEHPNCAVVGSGVRTISTSGKHLSIHVNPCSDDDIKVALSNGECPFWHPTVVIRKEVLSALGGYRKVVLDAEDHDLWLRIPKQWELANLPEILVLRRLHPHQVTIRKCRQMAYSGLAARAAAAARKRGEPDPLNFVHTITAQVLRELGVGEAEQEAAVAARFLDAIRSMHETGEESLALTCVSEMMAMSAWKRAGNRVMSDLSLLAGELYWHEGQYGLGLLSAGHALLMRPLIIGRPLKRLVGRLGSLRAGDRLPNIGMRGPASRTIQG